MRPIGLAVLVAAAFTLSAAPDPFAKPAPARVLIFVRTDCPITNRYAPELARLAQEFASRGVEFWLIYPDASETESAIAQHKLEYKLPGRYVAFGKARSAPQTHDLESAIAATLDGKPIKEPRTHSIGCYLADVK
jgi:hypothetical protein